MTPCDEYIIKMNQYLDGELPDREVADLFEHIEQCGDCRCRFESLRVISAQIRELEEYPPEELHSSIMAGIKKEQSRSSSCRRRTVGTVSAIAACALIAVALFSGVLPGLSPWLLFDNAENSNGASRLAENMDMAPAPESAESPAQQAADAVWQAVGEKAQENAMENETVQEGQLFPNSLLSPGSKTETEQLPMDGQVFVLPALQTSETFAAYCIVTGTGVLPEIFEPGAVIEYPDYGEIYIVVENDDAGFQAAREALQAAGFTIWEQVENLPKTDPSSERCLIVIFAQ